MQNFYLSVSTRHDRSPGQLTLVRILILLLAFANFLWIPSADSRVNKFAEESTRIWQSFPLILILVSLCLFEGITGSILPENPSEFHQSWKSLLSRIDTGVLELVWQSLTFVYNLAVSS